MFNLDSNDEGDDEDQQPPPLPTRRRNTQAKVKSHTSRRVPSPIGKVPITVGQLSTPESIDLLVERFTQTKDYKQVLELDRQFNCHAIEDAIREGTEQMLSAMREAHAQYMRGALTRRNKLLAEVRAFRADLTRLMRQDLPKLATGIKGKQDEGQVGQGSTESVLSSSMSSSDSSLGNGTRKSGTD